MTTSARRSPRTAGSRSCNDLGEAQRVSQAGRSARNARARVAQVSSGATAR